MMELVDNLYVYVGKNQPNVKLTRIEQFASVPELAAFFADLQEEYNVQFDTCETITDNLKVTCSSYGCKDRAGLPFYLVDYDGDRDCFHLWKADGDWKNARVFAMLHEFHSQGSASNSNSNSNWERYLLAHPDYINSPIREMLKRALGKLNVDWANVNLALFWAQFGRIYNDLKDKKDMENVNTIKMLVSLALLRCNVILNKGKIASQLAQFHKRAVRKFKKQRQQRAAELAIATEAATNSDSAESTTSSATNRESSTDSALQHTSASPLSPASPSEGLYTYKNGPLQSSSVAAAPAATPQPVVNQVLNNYYSHFKMMAEDYEQFDLKTKFNRERQGVQTRRRRKSNTKSKRISKIK